MGGGETLTRKSSQLASLPFSLTYQRSNRFMRFAERRSLPDQIISEVGSHHRARKRGAHALPVELQLLQRPGYRGQNEQHQIDCAEQRPLVILQILVVPTRQPLECRQQRDEIS